MDLTEEQEEKVASYVEAWRQADTSKKRAWLMKQAIERDEVSLCDVALMRSTYSTQPALPIAEEPALPIRCPRCNSPQPHLHPAVQHEGEGVPCPDAFHLTVTPQNTHELIARTQALIINLSRPSTP